MAAPGDARASVVAIHCTTKSMETTHYCKTQESRALRAALASLLSPHPARAAENRFVRECHQIALSYVYARIRRGQLQHRLFDLSPSDLALDCIADLFRRDDDGRFVQIVDYFSGRPWRDMSKNELNLLLCRLVASKVNEGLFRLYREIDPTLAKIIRNIKLAVKRDARLSTERRGRKLWITAPPLADRPKDSPLPLAPFEMLQSHLASQLSSDTDIPSAMQSFIEFTKQYPMYDTGYPLSRLAQAIRAALKCLRHAQYEADESTGTPPDYLEHELQEAITRVAADVKSNKYSTYVDSGKVDVSTFEAYFCAVKDILADQFTADDTAIASYYDALSAHLGELSKQSYQRDHRHVFEYLTKVSRNELVDYMRADYMNSTAYA